MRALVISWEYPPVIEGGLGRHVAGLGAALAAEGVVLDVLTRATGPSAAREEQRDGVAVHRVDRPPFPRDLEAFLAWVRALNVALAARARELIDAVGYDLVHSHDWLVADAARAAATHAGVPWLVTVHATEHGRHGGRVSRRPQSTIHAAERAMVADADRLVVCSRAMRDHLGDVFSVPRDRITTLRNGIDLDALRAPGEDPAVLRSRFAPAGEQIVLLAGRLVWEKGFDLALQALAPLLAETHAGTATPSRGIRILIAGAGPAEEELRAQAAALGIAGVTDFLGWVDDPRLRALYGIADVCVVPSRYEPFGIVALEAMACGAPCVLADVGGLTELAGDGETAAPRVAPGDVPALRQALLRVLGDDRLRARLAAAGRTRVEAYGWRAVAHATRAVYEELVPVRA